MADAKDRPSNDAKGFQLATARFAFSKLNKRGGRRFLVADEVGLGKTKVAREVIRHFKAASKEEKFNVVYVSSSVAIADQNLEEFQDSSARAKDWHVTRLTLLPLSPPKKGLNVWALTPGTSFETSGRATGISEERRLLYQLLYRPESSSKIVRILEKLGMKERRYVFNRGLRKLLQCGISDFGGWEEELKESQSTAEDLFRSLPGLKNQFMNAVTADPLFKDLEEACSEFHRFIRHQPNRKPMPDSDLVKRRNRIIKFLRETLAVQNVAALEPDLVILDEFQKYTKEIGVGSGVDVEKSRVSRIVDLLLDSKRSKPSKVLLLSATPYRILDALDGTSTHHQEFHKLLKWLFKPQGQEAAEDIRKLNDRRFEELHRIEDPDESALQTRDQIRELMMRVMCRTERHDFRRVSDTGIGDIVTFLEPVVTELPTAAEIRRGLEAIRCARELGVRGDIEYWRSVPYLFDFLGMGYEFRRKFEKLPAETRKRLVSNTGDLLFPRVKKERFEKINFGHPKLGRLHADTEHLQPMMWIKPSLEYTRFDGAFGATGTIDSKWLVFSDWLAVPPAVASLLSYDATRAALQKGWPGGDARDVVEKHKGLLVFRKEGETQMSVPVSPLLAWLLPSPGLAMDPALDPAAIAAMQDTPMTKANAIDLLKAVIEKRLEACLGQRGWPKAADKGPRDLAWYSVAAALVGGFNIKDYVRWLDSLDSAFRGTMLGDQVARLAEILRNPSKTDLGPRPDDLAVVLARLALAGPGVCAFRAIARLGSGLEAGDLFGAALDISRGFRSLLNSVEAAGFIRKEGGDDYWRLCLDYMADGNLQSLLDEHLVVFLRYLKQKWNSKPADNREALRVLSQSVRATLSMRNRRVRITAMDPAFTGKGEAITFQTKFAVRFGLEDEADAEDRKARSKSDDDDEFDDIMDIQGTELLRLAFNSPFRPFILVTTSTGQEGLDFHLWSHVVGHWNLPSSPVELEQREGRVDRYRGLAVRRNVAITHGKEGLCEWARELSTLTTNPWTKLFEKAAPAGATSGGNDSLSPDWTFPGKYQIQRRVYLMDLSTEQERYDHLEEMLAVYRLALGQPGQHELLAFLRRQLENKSSLERMEKLRLSLKPSLEF